MKNKSSKSLASAPAAAGRASDLSPGGVIPAAAGPAGADWPEVYGERELPALFGVYGEAVNILVGADGRIIGRDLSGADLAEAVRAALAGT